MPRQSIVASTTTITTTRESYIKNLYMLINYINYNKQIHALLQSITKYIYYPIIIYLYKNYTLIFISMATIIITTITIIPCTGAA